LLAYNITIANNTGRYSLYHESELFRSKGCELAVPDKNAYLGVGVDDTVINMNCKQDTQDRR